MRKIFRPKRRTHFFNIAPQKPLSDFMGIKLEIIRSVLPEKLSS